MICMISFVSHSVSRVYYAHDTRHRHSPSLYSVVLRTELHGCSSKLNLDAQHTLGVPIRGTIVTRWPRRAYIPSTYYIMLCMCVYTLQHARTLYYYIFLSPA